jgi:hypothetical protein
MDCNVVGSYRFLFDASEGGQDTGISGTIEALVLCPCAKRSCVEFSRFPVMAHTNPWTVSGHTFTVLDHTGTPTATADVVTGGGVTGLNAGFQTRIALAGPTSSADITLVHFAAGATVTALDGGGATVDVDTMSAAGGVPETLQLSGSAIESLIVEAPSNETLIIELCTA